MNKVALIGNLNNNFYVLQRYLIDNGVDCHLYIYSSDPIHFLPENDSWDNKGFENHKFLNWNVNNLITTKKSVIQKEFIDFNYIFCCGVAPAFLWKAGIPINMILPYGSDLYELPFSNARKPISFLKKLIFNHYLKNGIKEAELFFLSEKNPIYHESLKRLKFSGKINNCGVPLVYHPMIKTTNNINSPFTKKINEIKNKFDFIIFHHVRHVWKSYLDTFYDKGNYKLFQAFRNFIDKRPDSKPVLILFKYGQDYKHSVKMVNDLNLNDYVIWFEKMPRKELMLGISSCDLVVGELTKSSFTYGVVLEALAMEKPIMHSRDDNIYKDLKLYPMIHANKTEEIYKNLDYYYNNKNELSKIGKNGRIWYENHYVKKSIETIMQIIR